MLKSCFWYYSDAYMSSSGTKTFRDKALTPAATNNNDIEVILENNAPFTDSTSEINNAKIDNAIDIDGVMLLYISIEYRDNYSKTSGSLWKYFRDKLF